MATAPQALAAPAAQKEEAKGGSEVKNGPHAQARALEVHASLESTVESSRDIERVARQLATLAKDKGGFVANLTVGATADEAQVTVRIPPAEIHALREVLSSGGGTVTRESETATDVTEAIADIDARVAQASVEETRLVKLLAERTGDLGDVLAVEKTLAEVRERTERLQAEQRVAHGRVDLATVEISVRTAHAPSRDPGALDQLAIAAHEGVQIASRASLFFTMTALRAGPLLLMFLAFGAGIALLARRLVRLRVPAKPGRP